MNSRAGVIERHSGRDRTETSHHKSIISQVDRLRQDECANDVHDHAARLPVQASGEVISNQGIGYAGASRGEQRMSEITDPRPRVVVGVDGSDPSKLALRWAARIAAAEDAHIDAVMAWQMPTLAYASIGPIVDMQNAMEEALRHAVDDVFGEQRPSGMQLRTIQGGGAPVLLDASRDALMVVVGSRGRGGFAGLLLGSVSAKVAEHAECTVLIVR